LPGHLDLLLCDDDLDDCRFFKEALETLPQSSSLTAVHDGEQLMNLLTNESFKLPDVLFLDLNMPRKNGFECLAEIKMNKNLKRLPVIILSTSLDQEVVNLLYRNGAHYFIRKPSEFSQIKTIIEYALLLITRENTSRPAIENFVLKLQNI
jgi:CheY-like chemotaxis protein